MAKCFQCQHKISNTDRQAGKCPKCGAALSKLHETAAPPFDAATAGAQGVSTAGGAVVAGDASKSPARPAALQERAELGTLAPSGTADPVSSGLEAGAPGPSERGPSERGPSERGPSAPGTAMPPLGSEGGDDKAFNAADSIKPRVSFDKTEFEQSLSGGMERTQIEVEIFNASGTVPMEKSSDQVSTKGATKKGNRRKDSEGPESYLVIHPRDVSKPDEFNRSRLEPPVRYDYDVTAQIGEGGMGVVYQATQAALDRDVALKMIKPRGLDDTAKARYTKEEAQKVETAMQKRDRDWFLSEAVVTANLEHPYIVPIYDVIKDKSNALCYAMKWVRGTPWSKLIQEKKKTETEHLEILQKVSDAVAFAHEKGVIHRDLKPENVMVGSHGEVYVMDWGAALVTPQFERSTNLSQSSSGFGSVLYAAPELFFGSVEQITARSDVYLLGAILYEIISGYPPHPYPSNKSEALKNLRSNDIRPSDYKGELLGIALKAMKTEPAQRYASVQEFQTAIREYQSHTISLQLSKRARSTLVKAEQTGDYHDYARAVFAFDEAREMWHGNKQAQEGVGQAKLEYARAALSKGDIDLGLQTADSKDPAHADVIVKLRNAQSERDSRLKRLQTMRRAITGMAAVIVVGLGLGMYLVNQQREKAVAAEGVANTEREKADDAKKLAVIERDKAVEAQLAEEKAKEEQKKLTILAEKAAASERAAKEEQVKLTASEKAAKEEQAKLTIVANEQRMAADAQRKIAVSAAEEEKKAKIAALAAKAAQEYEAYVARIGLADSKVRTGAFEDVRSVLAEIKNDESEKKKTQEAAAAAKADPNQKPAEVAAGQPLPRPWEFARLEYLAGQSHELLKKEDLKGEARDLSIEGLALTRDGQKYVAGRKDGTFIIGTTSDEKATHRFAHLGRSIYAVAISPDGKLIATAGDSDQDGGVQLWSDNGENVEKVGKSFAGSKLAVYSVQFGERNGKTWLLTAGADRKAQVWDVSGDPKQPQLVGKRSLEGHFAAIRQAVFSPNASLVVTVGDDFRAVVWEFDAKTGQYGGDQRIAFELHKSAILAAAIFSATDKPRDIKVVTSDEDGLILAWAPLSLPLKEKSQKGEKGQAALLPNDLKGHGKAVHVLAFSDDGDYVLSGSDDNTIKLQRLVKRAEQVTGDDDVRIFRGHGGFVRGSAIGSLSAGRKAADKDRIPVNNWFIVSGSHDGTVMRWNVSTYRERREFRDQILARSNAADRDVLAAVFSPDGKKVLTGGRDHKGYQWDVRTGEKLNPDVIPAVRKIEEGHDLPIWTAAYSPRGDWLVTAGMDDQALLWNTLTGTQFASIAGTGVPAAVAVSSDGQWIATSGSSQGASEKVRFWSVDQLKNSRTKRDPARRSKWQPVEAQNLTVLAFSPDGLRLYSGFDNSLPSVAGGLVWEMREVGGYPTWTVVRNLPSAVQINAAAFLPGSNRLVTADENGDVWAYNLLDGETGEKLPKLKNGAAVRSLALHPDGKTLLTLSAIPVDSGAANPNAEPESYQIRLWDLAAAKEIKTPITVVTPNAFSMAISPQGDEALVVAAARKGKTGTVVHRYNLESGQEIGRGKESYLDSGRMDRFGKADLRQYWGAIYAPGANVGADGGAQGERRILALHGTRAELVDDAGEIVTRSNPQGQVKAVSYSQDGKFFLTAGTDGTIKIWDAVTLMARCQIVNPHGESGSSISSASFSPVAGSYQILSTGRDQTGKLGEAKLWNWDGQAAKAVVARTMPHDSNVRSAAFSHDGGQIVCGCKDGMVWVWNAKDEKQAPRKTKKQGENDLKQAGHAGPVNQVAFANGDDGWIVSAGDDNLAYVWKNGKALTVHAVLKGHAAAVRSVAFSPRNDRIVTGSADTFAKVWDPRLDLDVDAENPYEARELLTLSRHERPVTTVAFSPGEGKIVMTASNDGDTVLWLSK